MKSIKIIYEDYSDGANGAVEKKINSVIIPFGERTVEYNNSEGYVGNFENMVYEILQTGFVYINETEVITILSIKKFVGNNIPESVQNVQGQNVQASQNNQNERMPKNQKKWHKHNRRQRVIESERPVAVAPQAVAPASEIKP